MNVCMYVCMYVYMYVCTYVCRPMYVCMYVYVCACLYIRMYARLYENMYASVFNPTNQIITALAISCSITSVALTVLAFYANNLYMLGLQPTVLGQGNN